MSSERSVKDLSGLYNLRLEARVGFEPTNGGFADLSLGPLGYRAESLSIANLSELFRHPGERDFCTPLLFLYDRGYLCFAQKTRRFFRRCGIDVKAGAPFKASHFRQLRNDLDVPVVMVVDLFADRRCVDHEIQC